MMTDRKNLKVTPSTYDKVEDLVREIRLSTGRKPTHSEIVDLLLAERRPVRASASPPSSPIAEAPRHLIDSLAKLQSKSAEVAKATQDIAQQIESVHSDAEAFARSVLEGVRSRGTAKKVDEFLKRSQAGN